MTPAARASTLVPPAPAADLSACDREPIHIPGAIQPLGVLLCMRSDDLSLVQVSENAGGLFACPSSDLLGRSLASLTNEHTAARVRRALDRHLGRDQSHYLGALDLAGARMDMLMHQTSGQVVLELEETTSEDDPAVTLQAAMHSFGDELRRTESLADCIALAAREIKRLTGFGRILVYSFDADGHGHVIAEECDPGYDSYLDLHFPATDIPQQARALYLRNPLRLIADANYQPVPLVPRENPLTHAPLDLTHAYLRSVSPVHVQYMKNMRTDASMSVSIVVRGRLWGLMSCHHRDARRVPFAVRTACEYIGQMISLQIEAEEDHAEVTHRLELRQSLVRLLATMAERDDFVDGLLLQPEELLHFADAAGAALIVRGRCELIGETPPADVVQALAEWLEHEVEGSIYANPRLADAVPASLDVGPNGAGLLYISVSELHRNCILWFRPETIRTVRWAGKPDKVTHLTPGTSLNPRASFAVWVEQFRGSAKPWRASEIDTAQAFREAIISIVLRRAEETAELASELDRTNRELEAFSYSVSHDLRAPLRHIVGYTELLREVLTTHGDDRSRRYFSNIQESARYAGALVDDLLTFSRMGRTALKPLSVPLGELVERAIRDLAPEIGERRVEWSYSGLPVVWADPMFLQLVVRNLLSNAVKFTRSRSPATITIRSQTNASEHVVSVADNGVGFNMKYVGKLFGVFQRLHRMEDFEGTGIGLANVRRIVERHHGRVWAEAVPDAGATFYFTLPKKQDL